MNEQTLSPITKKISFNQLQLKIFAIIIMTIDHVSAFILTRILINDGMLDANPIPYEWFQEHKTLYMAMTVMRFIGRLAFPLFCYFLVEGFSKTNNLRKYGINLTIFALISEIPFDLAANGNYIDWSYQSVYVTLLIGLWGILGLHIVEEKVTDKGLVVVARIGVAILACALGAITKCDYRAMGVLTILVMYSLRQFPIGSFIAGVCVLTFSNFMEITAFLDVILIAFYNHQRGNVSKKGKYFFYAYYPAHLLIIWLVALSMGMGFISALHK